MTIDYGAVFIYGAVVFLAINAIRLHNEGKKGPREKVQPPEDQA